MQATQTNYVDLLTEQAVAWEKVEHGFRRELDMSETGHLKAHISDNKHPTLQFTRNDSPIAIIEGKYADRLLRRIKADPNTATPFPPANGTLSNWNRFWTCLKHATTNFREALLIEQLYIAVKGSPIRNSSPGCWNKSVDRDIANENPQYDRKETFTITFNGLDITVESYWPNQERLSRSAVSQDELLDQLALTGTVIIKNGEGDILLDYPINRLMDIAPKLHFRDLIGASVENPSVPQIA